MKIKEIEFVMSLNYIRIKKRRKLKYNQFNNREYRRLYKLIKNEKNRITAGIVIHFNY